MSTRILLLSEILPPKTGGSGRWLWEIYRRLPREQVVIAAGEDLAQHEFDRTHDRNVRRIPLSMAQWGLRSAVGLKGYARMFRAISALLEENSVECIHCARCLPEGWGAWLLKARYGIPYMCYVHGEDVSYAEHSRELSWMVRRVIKGATFLVANSENSARLLLDRWHVPERKVHVMTPGVDTTRFVPAEPNDQQQRQLGWQGRTVILTVGRLQLRKGQDMMIRALPAVRRAVPNVLYAIVGEGEEKRRLQQLAVEHEVQDCVQFRGEPKDDELIRCYQQCDLFVLPNRQVGQDIEGFGMVLIEAQSCGKPVVAGASGGTAETLREPETGRIVCCDQPQPLADTVLQLLDRPALRARMGEAARRWVVENFDWNPLSRRAATLFRDGWRAHESSSFKQLARA
jgi:phosphatidylinositol alpha-1,6-mannosyltransferase